MADGNHRDEFNSRLEAAEARTEARFVEVRADLRRLTEITSELRTEVGTLRGDTRFTRYTIAGTAIASVLAIAALAIALVQIDAAHQANLLTMFQTAVARR